MPPVEARSPDRRSNAENTPRRRPVAGGPAAPASRMRRAVLGAQTPPSRLFTLCRLCHFLPPPYGSREGYLVYCVFACHFVIFCTVMDLSAAGKGRRVKFCMRVGLLSRQVFSPFGEHLLAGSHGSGGITSGMNGSGGTTASVHGMGIGNWGRRRCLKGRIWWDRRLASLLTHLLRFFSHFLGRIAVLYVRRCGLLLQTE